MYWTTEMAGCPSQSWAFVQVNETNYGLFLSWRPDSDGWRGFVVPSARQKTDLLWARWSANVFAEVGLSFREEQVEDAQRALVRLFAERLGVAERDLESLRNGRLLRRRTPAVSGAQLHQIARMQPRRR